ncbi:F-box/LRR-repeat protein [Rhynchospora pubera]|uniref:F-box/LRR-repeat protein n=1 Tax=Rhynchospora pubera TaxID=906938 RepID=A0AAV8CI98_9POAL|nr:F-box/LRR-repeat protein [Rhynchospora pubera]
MHWVNVSHRNNGFTITHPLEVSSPITPTLCSNTTIATNGATVTGTSSRLARRWEDLNNDLLISILLKLGSAELIAGSFSSVCSSWRHVARDASLWRVLDFSDWGAITRRIGAPIAFHRVLGRVLALTRGGHFIQEVHLSRYSSGRDLIVISERLPNLLYLSLPLTKIEKDFCMALSKFKYLRGLSLTSNFLVHFGVLFYFNELFPNFAELKLIPGKGDFCNVDAITLSHFFPNLRKLEIQIQALSAEAITTLLDSLKILEHLHVSVSEESVITVQIIEKAARLKTFTWHLSSESRKFINYP